MSQDPQIRFRTATRGYNKEDVNNYISKISINFQSVEQSLKSAINQLHQELESQKELLAAQRDTLLQQAQLLAQMDTLQAANKRNEAALAEAKRIIDRYIPIDDTMGYLSVNGTDRPFFHAADAGMPVVNLLNYCAVERQAEDKAAVLAVCEKLMRHELSVTNEVANPFGYARQFVEHGDGTKENQFFYPHDVETAPWWQGENARIASLAAAARSLAYYTKDADLAAALRKYADDQINWVLGLNPFDSCMLEGEGRNNIDYFFEGERRDFIQCPGGIVNGITSALHDEHGIAFHADATDEVNDNWRWAEQWIPHATWYMYALCMKKI